MSEKLSQNEQNDINFNLWQKYITPRLDVMFKLLASEQNTAIDANFTFSKLDYTNRTDALIYGGVDGLAEKDSLNLSLFRFSKDITPKIGGFVNILISSSKC